MGANIGNIVGVILVIAIAAIIGYGALAASDNPLIGLAAFVGVIGVYIYNTIQEKRDERRAEELSKLPQQEARLLMILESIGHLRRELHWLGLIVIIGGVVVLRKLYDQ